MSGEERLRALLALHDRAQGDAVLKETGRGRVTRVPFDAISDAVCKEDRGGGLRSRLGSVFFGTRAERSLRAASDLRDAGFRVPEPLGLLQDGRRAVYFARCVEGPTLQAALGGDDAQALACDAATLAARLHDAGFAFRDLKPPNLVVTAAGLVPVDLDDVSRPRRLPRRIAWRNLAALDAYGQQATRPLSVGARRGALGAYATSRGLDARELLGPILTLSRHKRRRWEDAHGP